MPSTDEFRIGIAETYDVLIEPNADAYTLFAEAMDRSGFARGTLSTSQDATASVPERRARPLLTMADMGMAHGAMGHGMKEGASSSDHSTHDMPAPKMKGMGGHKGMAMVSKERACGRWVEGMAEHGPDRHGPGNVMVAAMAQTRLDDPGPGLRDAPWRVLTYAQLRRVSPTSSVVPPTREIELHLTGNMERYM